MGYQHRKIIGGVWASMCGLLMLSMTPVHAQASSVARVIGGSHVTSVTDYPWMGLLKIRKITGEQTSWLQCGASFIGDEWVLTAAHCVADKTWLVGANDVSVFAGQVDKDSFTPADEYPATQVYVHRDYNPESQRNDIALIRLSVPYSGTTLTLAQEGPALSALMTTNGLRILGWGKTSNSATSGSSVLQMALLNLTDTAACQQAWPGLPDSAFCAQGDKLSDGQFIDSCFGDSGGPLISAVSTIEPSVQVGIVSFGTKDCGTNTPSVYTRITSYLDWINGIQEGRITEVYTPNGGDGSSGITPPITNNCQIGGGIECGPGDSGGSFPLWIGLFLPLIYILRRRKHT